MSKISAEDLVNDFIRNAVVQGEATYSGKYKVGNKASEKLFKIEKIMLDNPNLAEGMLDTLLSHSNINVKIWASGISMELGYRVEDAKKLLKQIACMPDVGILGLNAEMLLKEEDY